MSKSGVVKFFNAQKGYGFITPSDGGVDLFVHSNELDGEMLVEGDEVHFDEQYDDRNGKQKATAVSGGSGGAPMMKGGGGGKGGGGASCYNCGQVGHMSRDCPQPRQGKGGGGGGKGGGGGGGSCYNCGQDGHMSRDCPEPRQKGGGGKGGGGGGGNQVCRQFQSGNCSYGDNCRFSHN